MPQILIKMKKYYLHNGAAQTGPYTIDELASLEVNHESFIWYEGLPQWTKAGELDELKGILKAIPPKFKPSVTPPPLFAEQPATETKRGNRNLWLYLSLGIVAIALLIFFLQNKAAEVKAEPVTTATTVQDPLDTSATYAVAKHVADSVAASEQEKKAQNDVLTKKYMNLRNNWQSYIRSSIDSKTALVLGGFKDVVLAVDNKTPYVLDYVEVEIHYWKANHDLFKTETMTLTEVEPNTGDAWSAPASERGTYITTEITKIKANKFHFCYDKRAETNMASDTAAITGTSGNPLDPWKCQ